ncbi:MAG TPA: 16S rRNA (uracil(1498)-N(3))-methyltransferase [Verrucomicrobiae bacterium]|nr:16S rRNA (uracil(1498)-N(3))-methyltransferase [Verrucomicrobiae bacterium]
MHRFFLPNLQQPVLAADEAHHAIHVLRLKAGDTVNVFDGRGHEAQAQIADITKDSVRLAVLHHSNAPFLPCHITLAQAIPKKSMDLIVQKATELGVASIVPLLSERTLVQLDGDSKRIERWREIALDACKQCGNNWLPDIQPPQKAREFMGNLGKTAPRPRGERLREGQFDLKLIASLQPDAQPLKQILSTAFTPLGAGPALHGSRRSSTEAEHSISSSVLLLIGPEGDFTPAELSLAKSVGCVPLSLGPLVLRAETAALYALSILHHELQNTRT